MNASVDAKQYISPGTGFHTFVGWTLLVVIGLPLLIALCLTPFIIALIILGLTYFFRIAKFKARLRGSALQINEYQFPEIYRSAKAMSDRLGLAECPEMYIMEDNHQNAFALKHGSKHYIILIDDIIYGATATGNARTLDFIIGHELAHHALGHTSIFRSLIRSKYLPLSRCDELTCDAVAHSLVGDKKIARAALTLLLTGPYLFANINTEALDRQAREVMEDKYTKKAERGHSHPLLVHRYSRIAELEGN